MGICLEISNNIIDYKLLSVMKFLILKLEFFISKLLLLFSGRC